MNFHRSISNNDAVIAQVDSSAAIASNEVNFNLAAIEDYHLFDLSQD